MSTAFQGLELRVITAAWAVIYRQGALYYPEAAEFIVLLDHPRNGGPRGCPVKNCQVSQTWNSREPRKIAWPVYDDQSSESRQVAECLVDHRVDEDITDAVNALD